MDTVIIYTDGGAKGNPGPGGFGVVLISNNQQKEINAAYQLSTNNRMELLAAITALESLKEPSCVSLHSDSKYVIDALTKGWLQGWKKRGWKKADKKPVLNQDLWKRLDAAQLPHQVEWIWVKGHAGNSYNERCDALVHEAIEEAQNNSSFLSDEGYTSSSNS